MPLEVDRPGDKAGERPRLSPLGRRVLLTILVLVVAATAVAYSRSLASRRRQELVEQFDDAIGRSRIVCANALAASGAPEEARVRLAAFGERIESEPDVAQRAAVAHEMISYCLGYVQGAQVQVDELNGARNRIVLALQQYEKAR